MMMTTTTDPICWSTVPFWIS